MIDALIRWLVSRSPLPINVVTNDTGTILFQRYQPFWLDEYVTKSGQHLNRPPWWRPFNILLHKWIAEHDGGMHDHPRWSITICLKGRIVERTPWSVRTLKPGSIVVRSRKAIHSFEFPDDGHEEPWTLFIVGRRNHGQNGYRITPF